jgi:hypothetical protein
LHHRGLYDISALYKACNDWSKATMRDPKAALTGTVTLIGSGEMSPSMTQVHRMVMDKINDPVQAVFLDTPAGFQLNVDLISDKARQYFKKHFNLTLDVASFKSSELAPGQVETALSSLKTANYIFAGPGSPTYTVKNWQDSPVLQAFHAKLLSGAHLVFASAASIALGSYALPVYEIYKVGESPFWVKGLNFFAPFGYQPVIISHWNNTEGGTHDTRFCYMGKPRMEILESKLPAAVIILGIDEHTAVTFDFTQKKCHVTGAGAVFLRNRTREISFPSGSAFDIGLLKTIDDAALPSDQIEQIGNKVDLPDPAPMVWPKDAPKDGELPAAFVEWLVAFRSRLRSDRKWDLADEIREKLAEFGILVEDSPEATSWKKNTT